MANTLDALFENDSSLAQVAVLLDDSLGGRPTAVRLQVANKFVYIVADPDEDTLLATFDAPELREDTTWMAGMGDWTQAVGKRIQWYWWLQNNQGYWDGLQIEFRADTPDEAPVTLQMVAAASAISVRRVLAVSKA